MTYRYEVKDDKLYLYCVCDSTLVFLSEMTNILEVLGFTNIETDGRVISDDRVPKDKSWCNYEFECSGVFPDNNELRSKFNGEGILSFDFTTISKELEQGGRQWIANDYRNCDIKDILRITSTRN